MPGVPSGGSSDFQKEIMIWLRSIAVILIGYLCGFIWMGLSDHFKLEKHDSILTKIEPQHNELYQMHKNTPHKGSSENANNQTAFSNGPQIKIGSTQ